MRILGYRIRVIRSAGGKWDQGRETGPPSRHLDRGFTLIETLIAISILAISLVAILQLFSGGLKSSTLSDEYTRGIFHAREKMDEILLASELTGGVITGEFEDGFKWKAEALPLDVQQAKDVKLPFRAFNIKVDVMWDAGGHEKHFTISAIKLVKPGKDNP
ncbi:MAG: type IV pilus modification PilV family protein [Syntrophales bacterium]